MLYRYRLKEGKYIVCTITNLLETLGKGKLEIDFLNMKCDNPKHINLTWSNLYVFGNDIQQRELNILRKQYIKQLKDYVVSKENEYNCKLNKCKIQEVGTINVGPASDIDFNIEFDSKTIPNFCVIFELINNYHEKYFVNNLDDLFDCNFYGSDFKHEKYLFCLKDISNDIKSKQREHAFSRAKNVIEKHGLMILTQRAGFDALEIKGTSVMNQTKECNNPYVNKLKSYFETFNINNNSDTCPNLKNVFETFSQAKYLERESYRSVGAYLDIVKEYKSLPSSMYLDSILDNYGFAIENLYKDYGFGNETCLNVRFLELKLMRFSKYLERICNTILLFFSIKQITSSPSTCNVDDTYFYNIIKLLEVTSKINTERKKNNASSIKLQFYCNDLINTFKLFDHDYDLQYCNDNDVITFCFKNINNLLFNKKELELSSTYLGQ